jgi:hypothetical protein
VGWVVVAGLAYSINNTSTPGEKLSYWVKYAIACLISSVLMFESTLHWLTGWRTGTLAHTPKHRCEKIS